MIGARCLPRRVRYFSTYCFYLLEPIVANQIVAGAGIALRSALIPPHEAKSDKQWYSTRSTKESPPTCVGRKLCPNRWNGGRADMCGAGRFHRKFLRLSAGEENRARLPEPSG